MIAAQVICAEVNQVKQIALGYRKSGRLRKEGVK